MQTARLCAGSADVDSRRRQPLALPTQDGAVAAWRRGEPSAESRPPRIPTTEQSAAPVSVLQGESSVIYRYTRAGKRGDSRTLPCEICAHIQPVRGHATTRRHIARPEHTMDLRRQSVRGTGVRAIGLAFLLREAMRQNSMPSQSGA